MSILRNQVPCSEVADKHQVMSNCLSDRFGDEEIESPFSLSDKVDGIALDFCLEVQDLHVWIVDLRRVVTLDEQLGSVLSEDELQRSRRFRFSRDRRRFLVARSFLRTLIGKYLVVHPRSIRFEYNHFGKPSLPGENLSFNLSHSKNLILYGLAQHEALGVDVERINSDFGTQKIAKRFFSPHEIEELNCLPVDQQVIGFFNCWTRKEAFIKALGHGLSIPLKSFDVTLAPLEPARILAIRMAHQMGDGWKLYSIEPAPGYVGAICAKEPDRRLRFFHYQGENDNLT